MLIAMVRSYRDSAVSVFDMKMNYLFSVVGYLKQFNNWNIWGFIKYCGPKFVARLSYISDLSSLFYIILAYTFVSFVILFYMCQISM
jgi:hypothetical protein